MRRFKRLDEPEFLAQRWKSRGDDWKRRRDANPRAQFHWHELDRQPVHHLLLPRLKEQTQQHCSFCDNFPVQTDTIEHFRPKSRFPRDAYRWENLYFCCSACQRKGDDFDEAALQPDAEDYTFDRYFRWDWTRGTIKPNDLAAPADQHRAEVTIRLYRLNEQHPRFRKDWLRRRAKLRDEPLDSHSTQTSTTAQSPPVPKSSATRWSRRGGSGIPLA